MIDIAPDELQFLFRRRVTIGLHLALNLGNFLLEKCQTILIIGGSNAALIEGAQ